MGTGAYLAWVDAYLAWMDLPMYAVIVGLAKFLLLATIWLLFLLAFAFFSKSAIGRFFPQAVQLGPFADINDGSKDIGAVLISRADELSRPVALDALFEVRVPPITKNFGAKEDLKFLDDVKLSVQGVDVPAVIRAFINALPDDHYTISAKPGNVGALGPVLNLEFRAPWGYDKSWLLRIERPVTPVVALPAAATASQPVAPAAAPPAAATTSQIVDRAIYTIWYHMYYDPKGLRWRNDLEPFTSARTLEAYYGGQQRLASYQRTFQASDLDEAEKEFRLLISEMPQYEPGWMLLGVTLLEKRSERDAIRAFERAQQLLAPGGTLPAAANASKRKTWLQARLFTAVALLQMYNWKDNHQALRILEAILLDIPTPQPANMSPQDFYDLRKIRSSVLFQIAHTVGHDLVLLHENDFVDALTEPPGAAAGAPPVVPASVSPPAPRQATLRTHESAVQTTTIPAQLATAKAQRAIDFAEEMTRIFDKQQILLTEAEAFLTEIDTLAAQLNKDEWKRERERLVGDLRNADGYARFRYAQRHEANDLQFRERCKTALGKLMDAQVVRPNEYTIMQNMGLIYGDPRFDPDGNELDTARALFTRSLEIKGRDYFGYEQLAALAIRQAYERGPEFSTLDAIKGAIAQAEKARELRPGDGTNFALLAQLHTLRWTKTTGPEQQDAASLVEAALVLAKKYHANSFHVWTAELQWQLTRLRASASQVEFDKAKVKLLTNLDIAGAEAAGSGRWNARDLLARTTKLSAELPTVDFEGRTALRWPS